MSENDGGLVARSHLLCGIAGVHALNQHQARLVWCSLRRGGAPTVAASHYLPVDCTSGQQVGCVLELDFSAANHGSSGSSVLANPNPVVAFLFETHFSLGPLRPRAEVHCGRTVALSWHNCRTPVQRGHGRRLDGHGCGTKSSRQRAGSVNKKLDKIRTARRAVTNFLEGSNIENT